MASSEWFLGVHIQNFENPYNVEIRDGEYCCCDYAGCSQSIRDLQGNCTTFFCQPYFVKHIRDASGDSMCSLDRTYQLDYQPSTSILDHAVLSIPFKEMELIDHVSTKSSNN